MREPRELHQDRVPNALADAVSLLREEPTVRPEWRADVLRRTTRHGRPARPVTLSIPAAIAAALLFAVLGAAGTAFVSRHAAPSRVALAPASAPAAAPGATVASDATPGATVHFSLVAPRAANVSLVGDFNHWSATGLPMRRSPNGQVWTIEVRMPFGRYNYAFLIDGQLSPDPVAPRDVTDDFGAPNSVVMVHGS